MSLGGTGAWHWRHTISTEPVWSTAHVWTASTEVCDTCVPSSQTVAAEAVRLQLLTSGASRWQLTVAGFGSTRPIADNGSADGRRKNRRIEFHYQDAY